MKPTTTGGCLASSPIIHLMALLRCLFLAALLQYLPNLQAESGPKYANFKEIPITSIQPSGWLKTYLETQRNGLTSHLEAAGYPFNTVGWNGLAITNNTSIEDWWPYEQNAYWVDGMERCGLLLGDEFLLRKAGLQIDYVLAHPATNGYLGPLFGGPSSNVNRWIHVVFFRALMAAYADGHHPGIPEALRRHYLAGDASFGGTRDAINIEAMLWTYGITGDKALLELAEKTYALSEKQNPGSATSVSNLLADKPVHEHGVTYDERAKLGAILYCYTGNPSYLAPSVAAFRKLDKYHMLVGGVNVSSEYLQPVTSTEAYETCDISDYTWSAGYLLMATGDAGYADRIERAVFNASPGSVRNDFKALQYFSSPNQVVCTRTSFPRSGGSQMSYAPNPGTECCPGNVNRCMPNYVARLWMKSANDALAAVMYGPCVVSTKVGKAGTPISIEEDTDYPFSDTIRFRIHSDKTVSFVLMARIPAWTKNATLSLNGTRLAEECRPGSFARVERVFKNGDVLTLKLPQSIELVPGPEHSVSVVRGPLVYSLRIEENWQVYPGDPKSTKEFPAYNLTAASPWNYALSLKDGKPEGLEETRKPLVGNPWSIESAPIELQLKAYRLTNWVIHPQSEVVTEKWDVERDPRTHKVTRWFIAGEEHQTGSFLFTPPIPAAESIATNLSQHAEMVRLVPYGCAKLRVSYFPTAAIP